MNINLEVCPGEVVNVRVNSELVAEAVMARSTDGAVASSRDDLEAEVRRSRAARRGMALLRDAVDGLRAAASEPDHVNTAAPARRVAFADGLESGLRGETAPHPQPGVLPTAPRHSPSFRRGYEFGESIRRAIEVAHT